MKEIILNGKYARDRLEIRVAKKHIYITAVIDNCGCDFVVEKKALALDIRA